MDRIRINLLWIFSTDEMSSIDQILSITAARNPSETFENWKFVVILAGSILCQSSDPNLNQKCGEGWEITGGPRKPNAGKKTWKLHKLQILRKRVVMTLFNCGKRLNQWDVGGLTYRYHTFVFRMVERTADPSCSGDKFNQCDVGIGTYFCTQSRHGWKFGNQIPCV